MKKMLLPALALLLVAGAYAQQKEGKIIYERSVQMQFSFAAAGQEAQPQTQTRVTKFEMDFADNKMIWRAVEEEMADDNTNVGGMVLRTFGGGTDDVTFCDLTNARKVETMEFFDKKFLITDSIRRGTWKLTDETKTILNHLCRKATSQRPTRRSSMTMNNGKMERKEVDDTINMVAWFTTDIPVAVGPEIQGQLPGLILELESNNGRSVYKAISISAKPEVSAIKEPTKGKKVTPAEFTAERTKMLEEMQRNGGGNGIRMRVSN